MVGSRESEEAVMNAVGTIFMSEKPILIFPTARRVERSKLPPRRGRLTFPTPTQQRQRLDAKFRNIIDSFSSVQIGMVGLSPENVIVLEVIGDVGDLARSAENVAGMEWLAEIGAAEVEQTDGFVMEGKPDAKLPMRLFALMTNQQAMQQLVGLWNRWIEDPNQRATRGFGPFKNVFKQLHDIRQWGPQDRLMDTGVLDYWKENLQLGNDPVQFQVELWCRRTEADQNKAYRQFQNLVLQVDGQCVRQRVISEIMYHGVLATIPRASVEEAVNRINAATYTELLRCDEVMFFRPSAQMASPIVTNLGVPLNGAELASRPLPAGEPVVALLDGCPLENHVLLANRIIVDDPDGLSAQYSPAQQQHGTAMASLISHGDLGAPGDPLPRPLYVRPIFIPYVDFRGHVNEAMPADQIPVDMIERAVRRLFERDGNEPAVAPTVRVINLSIGDASLPFVREISPLARLLDWLATKYNVLFVVSAGNQTQDLVLGCTQAELAAKNQMEMFKLSFQAILNDQSMRRPFSPAEAINVVTVGAVHADHSGNVHLGYRRDPFDGHRVPSPLSTVSGGFRDAVKPEILMEGGRQVYHGYINGTQQPATLRVQVDKIPPGQRVASPGGFSGESDKTVYCRGTSNAAALASRAAGMIYERFASLVNDPGGDRLSEDWMAVLLKTLLVHGASWAEAAERIEQVATAGLDWRAMASLKRRLLGYGEAESVRSLAGTEKRVLLLGWDTIAADEGHEYVLPLPPSLASVRYKRRLTVTLGWISPINLHHRAYRRASLFLNVPASRLRDALGLEIAGADRSESARGTTQHMVFEGDEAIPFNDGDEMILKVNCRSDAGTLDTAVRYAFAVTLEVADPAQIDIYTEILNRVRAPARVIIGAT
ncbi:MAG: S8 family peptidase [Phycisphaeraceae bacterium]|nr:S8 family peptidase [Phycisphaeraceae bacterium]